MKKIVLELRPPTLKIRQNWGKIANTPLPQSPTKIGSTAKLDLDLLKLLEEAKTKVRDPETIEMVEAAYTLPLKTIFGTSVNVLCHRLCLAPG